MGGALARPAAAAPACTLVIDATTGATLVHAGDRCDARVSPASTFKIPLALMGFDSGILKTADEPAWPYDESYRAWREEWKQTTTPTTWLRDSVVWYSQQLTRTMGMARFQRYVVALNYGNRDLMGDREKHDGLTSAWLSSSLQISPTEQAAMLRRLLAKALPVSAAAMTATIALVPAFPEGDGWSVQGKTGSGLQQQAGGATIPDRQTGWFIGWARKAERTVIFVRLIEDDQKESVPAGFRARDTLLADLPALLRGTKR